ncbi:hypothetical protein [Actinomadura chibensis]|uniref:WD40 repeat domain-containing protein n=1 Tax=Actinomadura chibensis TaxID=392828 RepID=A0A5D0NT02_9ACTN|nr:hypothetical protein [Actinomadura chibensis]TYB47763.1 hypothetical protein FXF69_00420 [Actinomadura chibensis]
MSGVEDRLRDALRATAEAAVDADRPRPLPERGARRPLRRAAPLRAWVIPVCAVLAVLALAAGVLGIRKVIEPPDRRLQHVPKMPRFVFASHLSAGGRPSRVEVRDSGTGRLVDVETAPRGTDFLDLAATGDGRTLFVLTRPDRTGACSTVVHRFGLDGSGRFTGRTQVPNAVIAGTPGDDGALAVTADGRRLAYAVESCGSDGGARRWSTDGRLGVIDADGGARRELPESEDAGDSHLSWSGSGDRLFFVRSRYVRGAGGKSASVQELRALPLRGAVGSPVAAASVRIRAVAAPKRFEGAAARPAGDRVLLFEGTERLVGASSEDEGTPNPAGERVVLLEVSAAGGRAVRTIRRQAVSFGGRNVLKADASGRYLITGFGLIDLERGGTVPPLRGVSGYYDLDW